MTFYPSTVRKIKDGQSVSEGPSNRSANDLEQRTDYLKEQLEGLLFLSRKLIVDEQPCEDACVDSQLVYFNTSNKWEPGIAEVSSTAGSTDVVLSNKGYIQGIIFWLLRNFIAV